MAKRNNSPKKSCFSIDHKIIAINRLVEKQFFAISVYTRRVLPNNFEAGFFRFFPRVNPHTSQCLIRRDKVERASNPKVLKYFSKLYRRFRSVLILQIS